MNQQRLLAVALLVSSAAAGVHGAPPRDKAVFSQVEKGMNTDDVETLLGPPAYVRTADYEGAKFAFMWVYCLLPYGETVTEHERHPHYLIKFSNDSLTVQSKRRFSDVHRTGHSDHDKDRIEYVFPEGFFAEPLAELAPAEIELDTDATKKELVKWLEQELPAEKDAGRVVHEIFEEQVKPDLLRQIEGINREIRKMLRHPKERISPGFISFEGPVATMKRLANRVSTGLSCQAVYHYFPCEPESRGRWVMHAEPVPVHAKDLRAHGKITLKPVPIHWEEFGVKKRAEFNLVGEVEVTMKLEYKGSTVGDFNPPRGLGSEIEVQPKAVLNVARTITLGLGLKSESKPTDSASRTFAPKSLLYSATFTAEQSREQ